MPKDLLPTEVVLFYTFNGDSFPMTTGILLEKIRLVNPKNISETKKFVRSGQIVLAVIDGTLYLPVLMDIVTAIKRIMEKKRLNMSICIVNQDPLLIAGTSWEQKPENTQKYLRRA